MRLAANCDYEHMLKLHPFPRLNVSTALQRVTVDPWLRCCHIIIPTKLMHTQRWSTDSWCMKCIGKAVVHHPVTISTNWTISPGFTGLQNALVMIIYRLPTYSTMILPNQAKTSSETFFCCLSATVMNSPWHYPRTTKSEIFYRNVFN
jgi:hypothetical protein